MPQKCACSKRQANLIHEASDKWQLLRRADRPADADGIVRRRLLPRGDVFERLGQIEIFQRIVEHDAKARPRSCRNRRASVALRRQWSFSSVV